MLSNQYEEIMNIYKGLQNRIKTRIPDINKSASVEIIDISIKVILEKLAEIEYRLNKNDLEKL